jgi:hypothetical protein
MRRDLPPLQYLFINVIFTLIHLSQIYLGFQKKVKIVRKLFTRGYEIVQLHSLSLTPLASAKRVLYLNHRIRACENCSTRKGKAKKLYKVIILLFYLGFGHRAQI